MSWLQNLVEHISLWPSVVKLLVLSLSVVIEYIFPIFPGDTIVILAGFLKAKGAIDLKEICFCILVGSLLGSFIAYQAGRFLADNRLGYHWVTRLQTSKAFLAFNHWYRRFGSWFLLFNRFFHGIRAIFFVSAGMIRLPLLQVLLLGGLSAIIYNLCLVLLGYWLGFNVELIVEYLYRYSVIFYILLSISLLVITVYFFRKNRAK